MKVLYITNKDVPYKNKFFNELNKEVDLTVLYESCQSGNRNEKWAKSIDKEYIYIYMDDKRTSFKKLFDVLIREKYDAIVISCINNKIQLMIAVLLKLFGRKIIISLDGEMFMENKTILKRLGLSLGSAYLQAGTYSTNSLRKYIKNKEITTYYFSPYKLKEIENNNKEIKSNNKCILVVGQYYEYKGLDIALEVVRLNPDIKFKFIGMGFRTEKFINENKVNSIKNVEVIPFLQKEDLEEEYIQAEALLLPSRKECWGLVVNEAASFGLPIISTLGSGSATEFLFSKYKDMLANPNNTQSLNDALHRFLDLSEEECDEYSSYLKNKSQIYSIEMMVKKHTEAFKELNEIRY